MKSLFCESRLAGLGRDYLAAFEATMVRVCASPSSHPLVAAPDIRKAGLGRFPFHVIFRVEPAQVMILAIAHHRRRPTYWVARAIK
ncbi:MAG: hypothetical protein IT478_06830 [Xanthomonadales bacterium]|nr:hypothetical protein [Xanthomonadales bacterium]MCC6561050.1 hypothetical protein [Xanthomonadales bacterium]